ncbi:unnamed protein product [Lasius platythorax]|uniref:Uncharacterized protein n=1 Tax=Lasius platythorax TaxID=488582 RepID=A0AAV2P561_9HYME
MRRSPGPHRVEFASFCASCPFVEDRFFGVAGGDFAAERGDRSRRVFPNEIARLLPSGLSRAIPISRTRAASKAGTPELDPGRNGP